jgi:hypothetical protein
MTIAALPTITSSGVRACSLRSRSVRFDQELQVGLNGTESIVVAASPQSASQGARSKGPCTVPGLRCTEPGGRVDQMGEVNRLILLATRQTMRAAGIWLLIDK